VYIALGKSWSMSGVLKVKLFDFEDYLLDKDEIDLCLLEPYLAS